MGPAQGSGSCQCCSSFSLILRSAMVSSTGAGFRPFPPLCARTPGPFCERRPWRFRPGAVVFGCVVFGAVELCRPGVLRRARDGLGGAGDGFPPRIEYGAGSPRERRQCARREEGRDGFPPPRERRQYGRERRVSWAQGEWSWLRCYGPRRPPGFLPPRERRIESPSLLRGDSGQAPALSR